MDHSTFSFPPNTLIEALALVETRAVQFASLQVSYRFEGVNKLDRDYSHWHRIGIDIFCCLRRRQN